MNGAKEPAGAAEPLVAVGGENLIDYVNREGQAAAHAGGSPFNVAMALGRQGVRVAYISPISTDSWGEMLAETLVGSGVVLTGGRRGEPTTMARVTVESGIPSYSFERDGTAERMVTAASLAAALPNDARAIHTGSLTLTDGADADAWEQFCATCYAEGRVVSLDPNVRLSVIADPEAYRARILRMCGRTHLLKLSDEDLAALFPGKDEAEALTDLRARTSARVIVLTRGGQGVTALLDGVRIDLPAVPVTHLADTVGAGDTFTATLLAGLADLGALSPEGIAALTGQTLTALLTRAATAAALNCAAEGCDPPTRAALDAALTEKA